MTLFKKSSLLAAIVLLFSAVASAQGYTYPVNPNPSGKQTTPFSNAQFSATFNGPVSTDTFRSKSDTSSNTVYGSTNHNVDQVVIVRFVDHDIAVDHTSSDFYADDDRTGGTVANRSSDVWEDHPFTYTARDFTLDGVDYTERTRFIIVNSREVIFISQTRLRDYDDKNEWLDFEYSLRIK